MASQLTRKGGNIILLEQERATFPAQDTPSGLQHLRTAITDFTRLYHDRTGDLADDEPLLISADYLTCALYHILPMPNPADLRGLIFGTGIGNLLQDIIKEDDFFNGPPIFVNSILQSLARLVLNSATPRTIEEGLFGPLVSRSPEMWVTVWTRRAQLLPFMIEYEPVPLRRDDNLVLANPLIDLLWAYNKLWVAKTDEHSAIFGSFIPMVATYLLLRIQSDGMSRRIFERTQVALDECLTEAIVEETERESLVMKVIFEEGPATANIFVERLHSELERFPSEVETRFDDALSVVQTFKNFARDPRLFPFLAEHGIHRLFVRSMSEVLRSAADAQKVKAIVWVACGGLSRELLQHLISAAEEQDKKLEIFFQGEDLISELARGVDLLCQVGNKLKPLSNQRAGMRLEELIEQRLLGINHLIGLLRAERARRPDAKLFLKSATTGAAIEWWPCLRALRTASYRVSSSPQHQIFRGVLQQWTELGARLSLDEDKERKRHDREAKQRCAWYACAHHRVTPDASVGFKKCGGCGESQYCGRECQSNDWKRGGHKQKCKRLKGSSSD